MAIPSTLNLKRSVATWVIRDRPIARFPISFFIFMNTFFVLLRSLFLSSTFGFLAPVGIIGSTFAGLSLVQHLPELENLGQTGILQVNYFLSAFGSGNPGQGVIVIGLAFALVGALFDAFAFCYHQQFRGLD